MRPDAPTRYLAARAGEQLVLLEHLVNTDSGTENKPGVEWVLARVGEELLELGFGLERIPQERYGDQLLARREGGSGRRLLLVGHADTVYPDGTAKARPFSVRGQRATGPGVLDMKGGLACLVYALKALRATGSAAFREADLTVFLNSDEELLSPTSREAIAAEARTAEAALILEPARPGGECVIARKGVGRFTLTVTGREAHAGSQPELGRSAVLELCLKVVALHALNDPARGITVNAGVVAGGTQANVIPGEARAEIDLRAWTSADAEAALARLRAIAETATVPETAATLSGEILMPSWEENAGTARLLGLLQEAGAGLGVAVRGIRTGGGSDGNTTARYTATLDGLGPVGSRAHSPEEYLELASLAERSVLLAALIERWYTAGPSRA